MIFVRISILSSFLLSICAYKTDTFPPMSIATKHYDLNYMTTTCYERSGADPKELMEFEMTEDMEHLPNSEAIKLYFRCFGELSESLEAKSNKLLLGKFSAYFNDLPREAQEIYLGMGKGCLKRARPIKDLLEFPYNITTCFKQNDNQLYNVHCTRKVIRMIHNIDKLGDVRFLNGLFRTETQTQTENPG